MRTPKFTVKQMSDALIASRGLVSIAARKLDCDPSTVQRYMERHPSIAQVVEEQRGRLVDSAELRLVEAVETKAEPWAIALVLKTLGKKRGYVERLEQTGADGSPIAHTHTLDLDRLSDDELRAIVARGRTRRGDSRQPDAGPEPPH